MKLTAKTLKGELWKTLKELRGDKIDPQRAEAVASQSREIIRVIRTQQSVLKQAKQQISDDMIAFAQSLDK